MKRPKESCCGKSTERKKAGTAIPEQVQAEIDRLGGFAALEARVPPAGELEREGRIHNALADPIRLRILYLVKDQPLCVCVINRCLRIADSKLSYHLGILKEAGLIEGEYHGNWIIYSISEAGSAHIRR